MRSTMTAAAVAAMALAISACGGDDDMSSAPAPSGGQSGTLYEHLGKKEGIATAIHAIALEAVKDPNLASYFFAQTAAQTPAGHPSLVQLEECLTLQLSAAAGGPEKYPAMVSGGFMCRSMRAAHAGLGIPSGEFDKFVTTAAGVLKGAGVADADITTIGTVLNGTKEDVAQDKARTSGPFKAK